MQFLLILFACIATCRADLLALSPDDFQQAGDIKIATIVHNTPSAVSHTTFTRVHNPHGSGSQLGQTTQPQLASTAATQTAVHQPKPSVVVQPVYTTQQLSVYPTTVIKHDLPKPQLVENIASPASAVAGGTPVVNSLTHTPAHLAYSARPIVYQMLPEIKPVRAISFEESVPSPRNKHYYRTQ